MESEKKTTKIVLSRSIYNPDLFMADFGWKVIPAGTELQFDGDGVAIYKDVKVFLYRIHKECIVSPSHDFLNNYFPDYYVHKDDEIIAFDGEYTDRLFTDKFGEVPILRCAFGIEKSISLASDIDNSVNWHEIIHQKNLDIHDKDIFSAIIEYNPLIHPTPDIISDKQTEYKNKVSFIIANKDELTLRLLSYSMALHPYEICYEDTSRGSLVYNHKDVELPVNPIRFGRGKEWVEEQIEKLPDVGRDGVPPEIIYPNDDSTLCVYCEIWGGKLLISPIGKEYGLELFCCDIFKDKYIFYRSCNTLEAKNCCFDIKPTPVRYFFNIGDSDRQDGIFI